MTTPSWRTPNTVLICGGLILTLAMGIRHGFGLFLQPMSADLHWGRETFALALAVQNLVWGATQPRCRSGVTAHCSISYQTTTDVAAVQRS